MSSRTNYSHVTDSSELPPDVATGCSQSNKQPHNANDPHFETFDLELDEEDSLPKDTSPCSTATPVATELPENSDVTIDQNDDVAMHTISEPTTDENDDTSEAALTSSSTTATAQTTVSKTEELTSTQSDIQASLSLCDNVDSTANSTSKSGVTKDFQPESETAIETEKRDDSTHSKTEVSDAMLPPEESTKNDVSDVMVAEEGIDFREEDHADDDDGRFDDAEEDEEEAEEEDEPETLKIVSIEPVRVIAPIEEDDVMSQDVDTSYTIVPAEDYDQENGDNSDVTSDLGDANDVYDGSADDVAPAVSLTMSGELDLECVDCDEDGRPQSFPPAKSRKTFTVNKYLRCSYVLHG